MRHLLNKLSLINLTQFFSIISVIMFAAYWLYQSSQFMNESAGLSLSFTLINLDLNTSYWRLFFACCLNTLLVGLISIVLSTLLGTMIAIMRISNVEFFRIVSKLYVSVFRNLPLLGVILSVYFLLLYFLPNPSGDWQYLELNKRAFILSFSAPGAWVVKLFFVCLLYLAIYSLFFLCHMGNVLRIFLTALTLFLIVVYLIPVKLQWIRVPLEFTALVLALMLYNSSYIAEIIRSGFNGINDVQRLSALSIGLSSWQSFYWVYLPQVFRKIMSPLISQYANIIKNSSLGAVIGYPDIIAIFSGTVVNQTGNVKEIILLICMFYALINIVMSQLLSLYSCASYERKA